MLQKAKRLTKYAFVASTAFIGGLFFAHSVTLVNASPKDIYGAAGVAVDSYQNQSSTFTLYADGHIVDRGANPHSPLLPGTPKSNGDPGDPYVDSPKFPTVSPTGLHGAPKVAVKALTTTDGTFIQFADGNVRAISDAYYGAPEAAPSKILRGTVGSGGNVLGGNGFSVSVVSKATYSVRFNTPYASVPSISVTCDNGATGPNGSGGTPLVVAIMQDYSVTGFKVQLQGYGGNNGFELQPDTFHFVCLGD